MARKKVIMLEGSHYDIGYQHGSLCRISIKKFFNVRLKHLLSHLEKTNPQLASKEILYEIVERSIPLTKKYFSSLFEEIRGIADGTELYVEDIFFLNYFLEIEDMFIPQIASAWLQGCTSFAVSTDISNISKNRYISDKTLILIPILKI